MSAITRGFERVIKEKELCKNDGYVSKRFRKSLKKFIASVQPEVKLLVAVFTEVVGKQMDRLVLYFGEDPKRCPYEQVIATLLAFVRMFNAAHEETASKQRQRHMQMQRRRRKRRQRHMQMQRRRRRRRQRQRQRQR